MLIRILYEQLLTNIFSYLGDRDLVNVFNVCKLWRNNVYVKQTINRIREYGCHPEIRYSKELSLSGSILYYYDIDMARLITKLIIRDYDPIYRREAIQLKPRRRKIYRSSDNKDESSKILEFTKKTATGSFLLFLNQRERSINVRSGNGSCEEICNEIIDILEELKKKKV